MFMPMRLTDRGAQRLVANFKVETLGPLDHGVGMDVNRRGRFNCHGRISLVSNSLKDRDFPDI